MQKNFKTSISDKVLNRVYEIMIDIMAQDILLLNKSLKKETTKTIINSYREIAVAKITEELKK